MVKEGMLEAQRMRVVCAEGDRARRVADVKHYIGKLDEVEGIVKEHQRLFFCRCKVIRLSSVYVSMVVLTFHMNSGGQLLGHFRGLEGAAHQRKPAPGRTEREEGRQNRGGARSRRGIDDRVLGWDPAERRD